MKELSSWGLKSNWTRQQTNRMMSRPKRPVNGRISVHTHDIVDELLDDNGKHELSKVMTK